MPAWGLHFLLCSGCDVKCSRVWYLSHDKKKKKKKRIQKNEFNCSNETKRNVFPPPSPSLRVLQSEYESTWQPLGNFPSHFIPSPNDWTWAGSSLILSTSGCSTESVSTNNPIYQRLQTNCKHPTLLSLLFHITVSCLVGRQTAASRVVHLLYI